MGWGGEDRAASLAPGLDGGIRALRGFRAAPADVLLFHYEVLALGHVLLRERHLLRAYANAARALPGALRRRRVVQARRVAQRPPFGLEPEA